VRIFFEQGEVAAQGLGEVFADDKWILPAPLGVEMGVADDVERGLFGEVASAVAAIVSSRITSFSIRI
jgi:hypothetical protein